MTRIIILGLAIVAAFTAGAPSIAATSAHDYFPPDLLSKSIDCHGYSETVQNNFERSWYSAQLAAAEEPSLYEASKTAPGNGTRLLRLSIIPSFTPSIFITIEQPANGPDHMTVRKLTGAGGYAPGQIGDRYVRALSSEEHARLDKFMSDSKVLDQPAKDCVLGNDGTEYILEALTPQGYRYINQWSPQHGPVHDLQTLLDGFLSVHKP